MNDKMNNVLLTEMATLGSDTFNSMMERKYVDI